MSYFTILHWISLAFFFLLFILLTIISLKEQNKKIVVSMIFASFLVTSMIAVFSMFVLDKYTKIGKLVTVEHRRILMNETIMVSGQVRNAGRFTISECTLTIKMVNSPVSGGNLKGSQVFNPRSSLFDMFGENSSEGEGGTYVNKAVIAKDLEPNELKNFSATLKYPTSFKYPNMTFDLDCR